MDPDELEIYTMEGFIYMGMKNDLAFLIDSRLAVFEHQVHTIPSAHRAEVTEMLLKEYDEEFHISCEKKISYEDGYDSGYDNGYDAGVKKEKARADEANRKVEILTRKLRGCSDEEIAAALNVPMDIVRECIAGVEREG